MNEMSNIMIQNSIIPKKIQTQNKQRGNKYNLYSNIRMFPPQKQGKIQTIITPMPLTNGMLFGLMYSQPSDILILYRQHMYCLFSLLHYFGEKQHTQIVLDKIAKCLNIVNQYLNDHGGDQESIKTSGNQQNQNQQVQNSSQIKNMRSKQVALKFLQKQLQRNIVRKSNKIRIHSFKQRDYLRKSYITIFQNQQNFTFKADLTFVDFTKWLSHLVGIRCTTRNYYEIQVIELTCKQFEQRQLQVYVQINKQFKVYRYVKQLKMNRSNGVQNMKVSKVEMQDRIQLMGEIYNKFKDNASSQNGSFINLIRIQTSLQINQDQLDQELSSCEECEIQSEDKSIMCEKNEAVSKDFEGQKSSSDDDDDLIEESVVIYKCESDVYSKYVTNAKQDEHQDQGVDKNKQQKQNQKQIEKQQNLQVHHQVHPQQEQDYDESEVLIRETNNQSEQSINNRTKENDMKIETSNKDVDQQESFSSDFQILSKLQNQKNDTKTISNAELINLKSDNDALSKSSSNKDRKTETSMFSGIISKTDKQLQEEGRVRANTVNQLIKKDSQKNQLISNGDYKTKSADLRIKSNPIKRHNIMQTQSQNEDSIMKNLQSLECQDKVCDQQIFMKNIKTQEAQETPFIGNQSMIGFMEEFFEKEDKKQCEEFMNQLLNIKKQTVTKFMKNQMNLSQFLNAVNIRQADQIQRTHNQQEEEGRYETQFSQTYNLVMHEEEVRNEQKEKFDSILPRQENKQGNQNKMNNFVLEIMRAAFEKQKYGAISAFLTKVQKRYQEKLNTRKDKANQNQNQNYQKGSKRIDTLPVQRQDFQQYLNQKILKERSPRSAMSPKTKRKHDVSHGIFLKKRGQELIKFPTQPKQLLSRKKIKAKEFIQNMLQQKELVNKIIESSMAMSTILPPSAKKQQELAQSIILFDSIPKQSPPASGNLAMPLKRAVKSQQFGIKSQADGILSKSKYLGLHHIVNNELKQGQPKLTQKELTKSKLLQISKTSLLDSVVLSPQIKKKNNLRSYNTN